ncbi:MAG: DNA pilot protein [Wigfec virus K19_94]|nr:MAG: DNA pilot protein [Wigfec virus K19_94]
MAWQQIAAPIVGAGMGIMTGSYQDERQIKQQQKLTQMQKEANKELAKYGNELQFEMWNKTNYGAQIQHMKEAGLNPGLMYGMGGGGGTTTGSASAGGVSGGTATGGSGEIGMGIQQGMQLALMQAQKENIEADTANKKVDADKKGGVDTLKTQEETRGIKFNNDLNDTLRETIEGIRTAEGALKGIEAEKANADWETLKATGYASGDFTDVNNRIAKQMIAEMEEAGVKLENAKKAGKIMDAEQIIKNFEAELTKEGIAPNSPFYVKIIGDLLGKIGLNPIDTVKTLAK